MHFHITSIHQNLLIQLSKAGKFDFDSFYSENYLEVFLIKECVANIFEGHLELIVITFFFSGW